MPLWRAATHPCRAMHPKTNETNKSLLVNAGFVAKLATKKMIFDLKIHLKGCSTTAAKHFHSHRNLSSQVRKTEAGTILHIDMQRQMGRKMWVS